MDKFELVYHSTDYNDGEFLRLAIICANNNWRLVLILPTCQKYSQSINECFFILGDDLLIYEIDMGMGNVLKARAEKYVQYYKNSKLWTELNL